MIYKSIIVILGQLLNNCGSELPLTCKSRVDVGYSLYQHLTRKTCGSDASTLLVLSGGGPFNKSEAMMMKLDILDTLQQQEQEQQRYTFSSSILSDCNLDRDIILEEQSMNTIENAIYSYKLLCARGYLGNGNETVDVHIVTNEFHIPRAKCIFRCIYHNDHDTTTVGISSRSSRSSSSDCNSHQCNIICHSADSYMMTGAHRYDESDRELDASEWYLSELLDREAKSMDQLKKRMLDSYNITVPDSYIIDAIREIKQLNSSSVT